MVQGGTEEKEKEEEKRKIADAYERYDNKPESCMEFTNLRVFSLSVGRNTISKGSGTSGILISNVKASTKNMNDPIKPPKTELEALVVLERSTGTCERVELIDNYVSEVTGGIGIVICSSSVVLK